MIRWETVWTLTVGVGCLAILAPLSAQEFEFEAHDTTIAYDVATGVGSGQVELTNFQVAGAILDVQSWSLGLAHDAAVVSPVDVEMGSYIQSLNGGLGPASWQALIHADGVTMFAIYSFTGGTICTYEVPKQIAVITYDTVPTAFAGSDTGDSTQLDFSDALGSPPVSTVVIYGGGSEPVLENSGTISLVPDSPQITRGDANGDGFVDVLADAIVAIDFMFAGGPAVPCIDAIDVNNDGQTDVADPLHLLTYGFGGGSTPPAPFPECGLDPIVDTLTCDAPTCP